MEGTEKNPENSLDKKLFEAIIEITTYILATDEDEAEEIFEDHKHEILDDNTYNSDTSINPLKHLPYAAKDEEPYGSDGRTVKEIWEEVEKEKDKLQWEAKHKTLFSEIDKANQKAAGIKPKTSEQPPNICRYPNCVWRERFMSVIMGRLPKGQENIQKICPIARARDRKCESLDIQGDCSICWEAYFKEIKDGAESSTSPKGKYSEKKSQTQARKGDEKEAAGKRDSRQGESQEKHKENEQNV